MFDSACRAKTYPAIAGRTEGVDMTINVSVRRDDELVACRARRTVFRRRAAAGPAARGAAT